MAQGHNFSGEKAVKLKAAMQRRREAQRLADFAEHIAEGLAPAEAAWRAGARREEGHVLLSKLRRTVGMEQAQ